MSTVLSETGTFSTITSVAVMQPARADVVIRRMGQLRVRYRRDAYPGPLRQRPGDQPGRGGDHDGAFRLRQVDPAHAHRSAAEMQEGELDVLGQNLSLASEAAVVELRKHIGFIFQQHNLFSSLTAIENVRMATALRPGASRR